VDSNLIIRDLTDLPEYEDLRKKILIKSIKAQK